jgi:hypothetical protein
MNRLNRKCFSSLERDGGVVHPLLPRHGIWLTVPPAAAKTLADLLAGARRPGELFASAWRETWQRIPLSARRRILKHWKNSTFIEVALTTSRLEQLDLAAACGNFGCSLFFMPYHDLPMETTFGVIAHELAHVYHWATDFSEACKFNAAETFATRKAEEWGFPQSRHHENRRQWSKKYRAFAEQSIQAEKDLKKLASRSSPAMDTP